jgi:potassium/hydrogen antiporter
MSAGDVIGTLAIVLVAGLACEVVAGLLRLPRMVVLLGAGALLGPHALDAVDLPLDSLGVQLLLTLGVSFILFYGGLGLSLSVLRPVATGLGLLAIPGIVLSALVTGAVATLAFDVPFTAGLLIGAVLAPTDPAILVPLFERLRVRPKVSQTIVAESALNDVTGAVLALSLAGFLLKGDGSFAGPVQDFVVDLAISTALGAAIGVALAAVVSHGRFGIWQESPVIAALLVVAGGYFAIDSAGGSGYLGAFVAGFIVNNMAALHLGMHSERERELRNFASSVTDVTVVFVFVTLGVNLPFDRLQDEAVPALATLAVLIAVARPLTVFACLLPDRRGRWQLDELLFLAWTRETGVVPAALTGVLLGKGIGYEDELVTVVALAVVVTLALQSTTKSWVAHRLGLEETQPPLPKVDAAVG